MCLNYIQIKEIHNNHFTKCGQICEYICALAKSKVSRGKLNLYLANDSTPFNRAFLFVTFAHLKNLRILFYLI